MSRTLKYVQDKFRDVEGVRPNWPWGRNFGYVATISAFRPQRRPRPRNTGLSLCLNLFTSALDWGPKLWLGLVHGLRVKTMASTLASSPNVWPRGQHFGLKVGLSLVALTSASAWNFRPRLRPRRQKFGIGLVLNIEVTHLASILASRPKFWPRSPVRPLIIFTDLCLDLGHESKTLATIRINQANLRPQFWLCGQKTPNVYTCDHAQANGLEANGLDANILAQTPHKTKSMVSTPGPGARPKQGWVNASITKLKMRLKFRPRG